MAHTSTTPYPTSGIRADDTARCCICGEWREVWDSGGTHAARDGQGAYRVAVEPNCRGCSDKAAAGVETYAYAATVLDLTADRESYGLTDEDGAADDEPTCSSCSDTGEGRCDGSSCQTCGGRGGESIASRRAARAEYLADLGDD